jgi:hypothetical protein
VTTAGDPVAAHPDVGGGLLEDAEVGLAFDDPPDGAAVALPVGLRAGRAHGRALAPVQHPEVNAGPIGGLGHRPAQRVDLAHQVTLADPADRRVAAHLADGFDVVGQQQRARTAACRRQGGLGPGVAAADHDHVVEVAHGALQIVVVSAR